MGQALLSQGRIIVPLLLLLCLAAPVRAAQDKAWEKEWNESIALAKKEGKVVVAGAADPIARRDLPPKFTARFGIPLEYIGGRSSDVAARLRTERQAGVYTIDLFLSGMGTMATILYPEKMLDPIRPALILPEVVDPSKWKKGKLWFMDPEEKYILRLFNNLDLVLSINTSHVKPEELKSIRELLNPKWKGKISVRDPTIPGGGSNSAAQLYVQFGEDFVKRLFVDQKPAISRDSRQLDDWLGRGSYPISLGVGGNQVKRLHEEGFPVLAMYSFSDMPGIVGAGDGLVALMNKAPHPHAARLFANWIASKEGLELFSRARIHATTRNDIDESFLPAEDIPRPGADYFDSYSWEFTVTEREKVRLRVSELLKGR